MHVSIFATPTELRTLRTTTENRSRILDTQNTDEDCSLGRLKNLEHLEITLIRLDDFRTLIGFKFLNLKYFHFDFRYLLQYEKQNFIKEQNEMRNVMRYFLDVLPDNAPNLEILRFQQNVLGAIEFVNCCKKLKRLQHIVIERMLFNEKRSRTEDPQIFVGRRYVEQIFNSDLEDVEKLFEECPSLHSVASARNNFVYCYDRFSKVLKEYKNLNFNVFNHKHNVGHDL